MPIHMHQSHVTRVFPKQNPWVENAFIRFWHSCFHSASSDFLLKSIIHRSISAILESVNNIYFLIKFWLTLRQKIRLWRGKMILEDNIMNIQPVLCIYWLCYTKFCNDLNLYIRNLKLKFQKPDFSTKQGQKVVHKNVS